MQILKILRDKFSKPSAPLNFYKLLGEEVGLRALVADFYTCMENDPKAQDCLKVHSLIEQKIEEESKDKLFMFLSGWLGGPNLFVQNIGAPKMHMRHAHIKIGEKERVQWLYCMEQALLKKKLAKREKKLFLNSLTALSLRIKNS